MDPVIEASAVVDTMALDNAESLAPVVTPENTSVDNAAPQDSQPAIPDNVVMYQDVISKHKVDPGYQMTEEESEAFLTVQEKIVNGDLEEPPPKGIDATPDKEVIPDSDVPPVDEDKSKVNTDSVSDSMMKSMSKVGAKDVTELPDKIQLLINSRDSSGGKLGQENKNLQASVETLTANANSHMQFLADLKEGKPEAIEYLRNTVGVNPEKILNAKQVSSSDESTGLEDFENFDPDDFVDDRLAKVVMNQQKLIKDQAEIIKKFDETVKGREQENLTNQAVTAWVDDIVRLTTSSENQAIYGLSPTEVRGLSEQYFDKKISGPIHPKMQKIHELIVYANENNMPNLDVAHVMLQHEGGTYARKVIDAEKRGQQSVNHKPSVNIALSEQQSRQGNQVPEPTVTDDSVDKMANGAFDDIPDHWMDESGNLIPEKVPERFHLKAFGQKAGRPK